MNQAQSQGHEPTEVDRQADAMRDALSHSEVLEGEGEFIARTYAEALVNLAQAQGKIAAVLDEFKAVLDVAPKGEALRRMIASPLVPNAVKERMLQNAFGEKLEPVLLRFLRVVARKGRLGLIGEIYKQARYAQARREKRIRVEVSVARPLEPDQLNQVRAMAASLAGGEAILDVHVEPAIIGGLIVRVGDDLYDRSVRTQLNRLLAKLLERNTHEIQDRRDQFRHSA